MILTNGLLKLFGRAMVLGALLLVFGRCGSSDDGTPANISAVFMETETTTLDAKGYATDPRLVLTGPVGTAYTVTVTEGGSWCWTSRRTQATTKSAQLVAASEVIYLYLDKNETGASRRAAVDVVFDGGHEFTLTIDQADYSVQASMDHAWAELPAYVEAPDYRYVTHYAPLSSTVTARNFTICYDTKKRIANWVAYPIHSCYRVGKYERSNAWKYDPEVPEEFQVDLSRGSYNGRPIRGHQCMSYHRYVSYSSLLNEQTFYSTNIMPQDPDFNSGSWGDLEDLTLKYISYPDTLYNVTGTYGVQGYTTDKEGNRVAIPQYCWKVLLRTKSGRTGKRIDQITDASQLAAIGYWAENSSTTTGNIKQYITSVADIEEKTGYKFFTMLDEAIAADVKAQNNPSDWGIN